MIHELTSSASHQHLVHRFGLTEGLFKGVALASNISLTALISLFPGLGADPILASTSIHFFFAALLEMPTSFIAHRYGPHRSVLIGLILKFFATAIFIGAFWSAQLALTTYVLWFMVVEAFVDGLANAFISGAWQSAYSARYTESVSPEEKNLPGFFYQSAGRGLRFRLGIPVVLVGLCLAFPESIQFLVYVILVLRILVTLIVWRDLGWREVGSVRDRSFVPQLNKQNRKDLIALVCESFVFLVATSYLPVKFYREVQSLNLLSGRMIWHTLFFVFYVLSTFYLTRRIDGEKRPKLLLGLCLAGLVILNIPYQSHFLLTLLGLVLMAPTAFLLQRLTTARLIESIDKNSHLGWLGVAQAAAMVIFSFVSYFIIQHQYDGVRWYSLVCAICVILSLGLKDTHAKD